jgi:hypothetical protein
VFGISPLNNIHITWFTASVSKAGIVMLFYPQIHEGWRRMVHG